MAEDKSKPPAEAEKIEAPAGEEAPKEAAAGGSPKVITPEGLPTLIQQFARGETDAETVAGSIRKNDPERPATNLTYEQKEKRAMEDDHGDPAGTFSQVVAAWVAGEITDAQYNQLRQAFTPEGAVSGEEADAGEEEQAEESSEAPEA